MSRTLRFDDNARLAAVMGEHDRNIALLERELGVAIAARGNVLEITGSDDGCEGAEAALNALYDTAVRQPVLGAAEVRDAIRMGTGAPVPGGLEIVTRRRTIRPRSHNQAAYLQALHSNELVFGVGPAGTGKTYMAVAVAVQQLVEGRVDRLILSRPAVEAGEKLGFLPGTMQEKIDPYLRPLYDALYDMLPAEQVQKRVDSGEIEVAPLAFMRGRTLAHSYVILDEAQNTTPVQMKMFLTRLGEGSQMAITGDPSQVDLPMGSKSGLGEAISILDGVEGVGVVRFDERDVVRHPLVTRIVKAYGAHERDLLQTRSKG